MKRREISIKKLWLVVMGVSLLLVGFFLSTTQTQAASEKSNALKNYKMLLEQDRVPWASSAENASMKGSKFAILYIDNDNVPELIIESHNPSHASGWGRLYTFKDGSVVEVDRLELVKLKKVLDTKPFTYYEKTGIYADGIFSSGNQIKKYNKLSEGIVTYTGLTNYYGWVNPEKPKLALRYYTNGQDNKPVKKAKFIKKLNQLTNSQKALAPKFYKNTKANRNKYLK